MKKGLGFFALTMFLTGVFLTSCDSFMQAGKVKDQLEEMIAYANAPSYKITIEYNPDEGVIRAPALGETHQKVTDVFDLKFELAKDHVFYKWEASSVDLPAGDKIEDYIEIENPLLSGTRATFKKELTNIVIKASAPGLPYTDLTITGSKGKFSPSKGTYACIDTYSYPISFDPDQDYEFICWEIYDRNNDGFTGIIENGTYIEIDDIYSAETSYKLVAVPQDPDLSLGIRPVIAERPQTLSCTPMMGVENPIETAIQVIFDHDMDPYSIYYTQDEIDELIDSGIKDFLPDNNAEKRYGYKKKSGSNELYYYKNISIIDENGNNLLSRYNAPVFETGRILTIAPKADNPIPMWSQINVTLDKSFFYKESDKDITMPMNKKWVYMATDAIDKNRPTISKIILKAGNTLLTAKTEENVNSTNIYESLKKINLELTVQDIESGPSDTFEIKLTKGSTEIDSKSVYYQSITSQRGIFKGDLELSAEGLTNSTDYKMTLTVRDKTGRAENKETLEYLFTVDTTRPPAVSAIYYVGRVGSKYRVAWLPATSTIDKYIISWSGQYPDEDILEENNIEVQPTEFTYDLDVDGLNNVKVKVDIKQGAQNIGSEYFDVFTTPSPNLSFFMPVNEVLSISGRGTIAKGTIARGLINIGEQVQIIGYDKTLSSVITGVEINRTIVDFASEGAEAGLLLRGVSRSEISRGMFVVKANELQNHKKFKAYLYKILPQDGGSPVALTNNQTIQIALQTAELPGTVSFEGENLFPGAHKFVEINLDQGMPIYEGEEFFIRDGGKTIAHGTIMEVLE